MPSPRVGKAGLPMKARLLNMTGESLGWDRGEIVTRDRATSKGL